MASREKLFPQSGNIKKITYASGNLDVEFMTGSIYRYLDVPESVFDEACNAASIGSFVAKEIKPKYQFLKIS